MKTQIAQLIESGITYIQIKNLIEFGKGTINQTIITRKGGINKNFQNALHNCVIDQKNQKIYYFQWRRFGKSAHNYYAYIKDLLMALNHSYGEGNDAPKRGRNGDYIKVSKTTLDVLLKIRDC